MKLSNSTAWPDYAVRRMVSWICGELECKVADVTSLKLRNRADGFNSGRCWSNSGRIVVSLGVLNIVRAEKTEVIKAGEEYLRRTIVNLVSVTAHEIAHRALWLQGEMSRFSRKYNRARRGSSEARTEFYEKRVLDVFKTQMDSLLAQWLNPPERVACRASESVIEKRAKKAQSDLARWERKLKLAKTKVSKLRTRVKYYRAKELTPEAV